jgi:hypothetical protein
MKHLCGLLIIVLLLPVSFAYGQGENNSALEQKVTIEAHQQSIAWILDKIALQAKVYFSYDPSLVKADRKIDALFTSKTIHEILDAVLEGPFTYRMLDNQIVITTPDSLPVASPKGAGDSGASHILLFRGKLLDHDHKEQVPYASISVLRNNLGTISNIDGDFELKLPDTMIHDTVVVSCMGYKPFRLPVSQITPEPVTIYLWPANIQLQEIKVVYISPQEILKRVQSKVTLNYPVKPETMTSFYREVLRQDNQYIDVAEAVMDIHKASYEDLLAEDKVKFIKGRKSLNVKPFHYVDFKIQGGPYYITRLDVVKTVDSFMDPEYSPYYKYSLDEVIDYDDRLTYVISFKPKEKAQGVYYMGKLYVDMSSFALVKAEFEMSREGLKFARESLIQKKPHDLMVRPVRVLYQVSYRHSDTQWHLSNARASINFRVKSKTEKVNSLFSSVSELLVTDIKPEEGTRYKRNELFSSKDIFTEMVNNYDDNFWEDYNTIVPSEDLREALKKYYEENDTLFNTASGNRK